MSALDDTMREIMVQGTPDLQEVHLYHIQKLQSLEDELASIRASTVAEIGDFKDELASIRASTVAEIGELKDELASTRARGVGIRSCFCAHMDTTLWSTLHDDLKHQIFARLPLRDIIRLQCLSKEWKRNVTSRDSKFNWACAEASPKMFAMVSKGEKDGLIIVKLCDLKANRWHSYVRQLEGSCIFDTVYAGDGGLVCVVFTDLATDETPVIKVFNPLDPEWSRVLPRETVVGRYLRMVQLVMDQDRRCYKVLAVGEKNGDVVAKIFSSETGAWNDEISEGLVFGHQFDLDCDPEYDREGPCAYDSVGRELLELHDDSHPCEERIWVEFVDGGFSSECYALVKDHLFVLHEEAYDEVTGMVGSMFKCRRYCISEYLGQKCVPHWVKLRMHRCKEFERPPTWSSYKMRLYACKGFLLVKADNEESEAYRHVLTWVYDMTTEKWQTVPPFAHKTYNDESLEFMYELQWDAIL